MLKSATSRLATIVIILVALIIGLDLHCHGLRGLVLLPLRVAILAAMSPFLMVVLKWIEKGETHD